MAQCDSPLSASNLAISDHLGVSVSVSGDVAIVGANLHSNPGTNSGAAWISRWNGSSWSLVQKLQGSDTSAYDEFGLSVSIDGNVAVVAAPGKYTGSINTGATYVFRYNGSSWVQEQKLPVGVNGMPYTSWASVSLSGDTIVIGNAKDNARGSYAGAAYVYRYHPERAAGDRWIRESLKRNGLLEPRLTALDAASVDYFGLSVATNGDWIVVGSYADGDRGSLSGSAYLFKRNDNGTPDSNDDFWEQKQKLVPADGAAYDQFGYSVAIDANTVVIGANGDSNRGTAFGSAYVFGLVGSTWVQQAELFGSVSSSNGMFGNTVAVAGDSIVVGAPRETPFWTHGGAAYVFRKVGPTWIENQDFRLEDPDAYGNNSFGYSVAAFGDWALVGAINALGVGTANTFDGGCLVPAPGCTSSADCDDGNACTTDSCVNETCQNANHSNACADDGNPCTNDVCSNGSCTHPTKANGSACGSNSATDCDNPDTCAGGVCVSNYRANGTVCTDDGSSCTYDRCNATGQCAHPNKTNGTICDDGNAATAGDVCANGVCAGTSTAECVTAADCNDANACTTDSCSGGSCQHVNNTGPCPDDGNECTNDTCGSGVCTHPNKAADTPCGSSTAGLCDNPDTCNGGGVCLANHLANATACADDGNECTNDSCNSGLCTHPAKANSTPCNDGNVCTDSDSCWNGACIGGAELTCDDSDACTIDTCGPKGCRSALIVCPAGQSCVDGTCTAESQHYCNDGVCDGDEDACNCPGDCQTVAGLCGNGVCDAYAGEDCRSCPVDCRGRQTGPLNKQFCCGDDDGAKPAPCASSACNARGWVCLDAVPPCR
jgi:hypothetical protein